MGMCDIVSKHNNNKQYTASNAAVKVLFYMKLYCMTSLLAILAEWFHMLVENTVTPCGRACWFGSCVDWTEP